LISGHGQVRVYSIKFPRSLFPDEPNRKTVFRKKKNSQLDELFNNTNEKDIS